MGSLQLVLPIATVDCLLIYCSYKTTQTTGMSILLQGIYAGLLLAILVGPLVVALVQASLEQGTKAGIMVGLGIWISDLSFIVTVYFGMSYIDQLIKWPYFELTVGIVGSLVLLGAGIGTLMTKAVQLDGSQKVLDGAKGAMALLTKGFLINTVNPFTFFFWIAIMTGVVLENNYDISQAGIYFTGIIGTIIFTDSLKIFLAKKIRHRLTSRHLWWVRRVAGVMLVLFAIVLAIRVLV